MVLQIIKSLIKLIGLIAVVYILLTVFCMRLQDGILTADSYISLAVGLDMLQQ